mgnify:FL=1
MKRTKRIFSVLLGAALAAATVLSAASCAGDVHEHTLRQVKAKEATCFEDGNLAYWECTECKKLFSDAEGEDEVAAEEVTLPAHHTPQFVAAVKGEGTFETSSIAHYVCTVCGSMFANEACTLPLTSEEVYEIKTYALSDARVAVSNGTSAVKAYVDGVQTTLSVTQLTFGLRIFLGWETDGCVADDAKYSPEPYRLNLNLDTQRTDESKFYPRVMLGCDTDGAWVGTNDSPKTYLADVAASLDDAFREDNGVYLVVLRDGEDVAVYGEDKAGERHLVGEYTLLDTTPLLKVTLGVHDGFCLSADCPAVARDGAIAIGLTDAESGVFDDVTSPAEQIIVQDTNAWVDYPAAEFTLVLPEDAQGEVVYSYDESKLSIDGAAHTVTALAAGRHQVKVTCGELEARFFVTCSTVDKSGAWWQNPPHAAYDEELAQKYASQGHNGETTVFIGDSFFDERYFFTNFSALLAGEDALCMGISSTTTFDWEQYILAENTILSASMQPKALVVNLGTNNFYDDKRSTADTASDLQRLFTLMHDRMPDTHIYYFSIAQRLDTAFAGNVSAVNDRMEEWCRYKDWITFLDVEEQVTTDKLRDDHVHPLPETYRDIYLPALRDAGWH